MHWPSPSRETLDYCMFCKYYFDIPREKGIGTWLAPSVNATYIDAPLAICYFFFFGSFPSSCPPILSRQAATSAAFSSGGLWLQAAMENLPRAQPAQEPWRCPHRAGQGEAGWNGEGVREPPPLTLAGAPPAPP